MLGGILALLLFLTAVACATWDTWRITDVEREVWLPEDDPRRVR